MTQDEQISVTVTYGKHAEKVQLPPTATLQQLGGELAARFYVAPPTIKLLVPGVKGALHVEGAEAQATLQQAGAFIQT
jgi:hypothetical protein